MASIHLPYLFGSKGRKDDGFVAMRKSQETWIFFLTASQTSCATVGKSPRLFGTHLYEVLRTPLMNGVIRADLERSWKRSSSIRPPETSLLQD